MAGHDKGAAGGQDHTFHKRLDDTLTTKTGTERRFAVWKGEVEGLRGDDKCLQDAILLLPAAKFANEVTVEG